MKVTGYHRKHAIRLLADQGHPPSGRPAVSRIYQQAVQQALIVLWEASDRICAKRLKALLPLLLASMERHGHLRLEESVRTLLPTISAATIDRMLRSVREQACGKRKRKTAANHRVRKLVPVRTFADWGEVRPGYMEMDLAVHCGPRLVVNVN